MLVSIDSDACNGCEVCIDICPDVFDLAEDGLTAVVAQEEVPIECEDECLEAAKCCSVNAIFIDE